MLVEVWLQRCDAIEAGSSDGDGGAQLSTFRLIKQMDWQKGRDGERFD